MSVVSVHVHNNPREIIRKHYFLLTIQVNEFGLVYIIMILKLLPKLKYHIFR
jgi:hypothetical protein